MINYLEWRKAGRLSWVSSDLLKSSNQKSWGAAASREAYKRADHQSHWLKTANLENLGYCLASLIVPYCLAWLN